MKPLSLTRRLVFVVSALLAVSIGAVVAVAYHEIRLSAELAETRRIQSSVQRVAVLFEASNRARIATFKRITATPAIHDAVISGMSNKVVDSILGARVRTDSMLYVALIAPNGRVITSAGQPNHLATDIRPELVLRSSPDSGIQSPLITSDSQARTWSAMPILDGGHPIGMLAQERRVRVSAQTMGVIDTFFVTDAKLLIRNRHDTGPWVTLLGELVPPPTSTDSSQEVVTYRRSEGKVLSASSAVGGMPFAVVVEVPLAAAMGNVGAVIRTLLIFVTIVGIIAILVAVWVGRRIAQPVVELTDAAEAIAQGQYERRVGLSRNDEVGRLAAAFDKMAAEVESAARSRELLTEVSAMLAETITEGTGLEELTRLCVPRLADICSIHIRSVSGALERAAFTHVDPAKRHLVEQAIPSNTYAERDDTGAGLAVKSQEAVMVPNVDDSLVRQMSTTAEQQAAATALGICSYLAVPLVARGRVLGAISLVMSDSGRHYTEADTIVARELARRAAIAIDNGMLYRASVALRLEAEGANRAKSDFLATMSHEIRTPINAMIGYTELLHAGISGPVTEGQKTQLERIRASGTHLTGLVDELLDLAKIEARQMTVGRVPTPCGDTVERAILHVRPQAAAKQIHIAPRSVADAPLYLGDPQRVEQIITNLLSNAVKFTGSGGRISVEWGGGRRPGTTAGSGDWVWIAVTDTGIGISAEDLARIFQPFVQVENGYTRGTGGTGLGLAISRQLAMIMGGDLAVESTPGSGSRFTLWLPAVSPRPAVGAAPKEHAGVS